MATGKKAKDIFTQTAKPEDIGVKPKPQGHGRQAAESYQKVTVCLFDRHVLFLDKVALAIREKTGQHVRRAELVRAIVDQAAAGIDPERKDFDKAVRSLLPGLKA